MDDKTFWLKMWQSIMACVIVLLMVGGTLHTVNKDKEMEYLKTGGSAIQLTCSQSSESKNQVYCLEALKLEKK